MPPGLFRELQRNGSYSVPKTHEDRQGRRTLLKIGPETFLCTAKPKVLIQEPVA